MQRIVPKHDIVGYATFLDGKRPCCWLPDP
jgi:hypothetical protein